MAEKKITKREMFEMIKEVPGVAENEDMVTFLDHEIELLKKKNTKTGERKLTKRQEENIVLTEKLVTFLTAKASPVSIKQIQTEVEDMAELSNQRLAHLLTPLVKDGRVEKTSEKGLTLYRIIG